MQFNGSRRSRKASSKHTSQSGLGNRRSTIEPLELRQLLSIAAPLAVGTPTAGTATVVQPMAPVAYGSINGLVTDTAGNPLAGAAVVVVSPAGSAQSPSTTAVRTDALGQYNLSNVPVGTWAVRAYASGYQSATSAPITVTQGSATPAPTLALAAYSSVNGTITDSAGNPLANASVILVAAAGTNATASGASAKTDANGQYALANVMAGSYVVRASATGYQAGTTAAFTVAQGATVTAPTLALVAYSTVSGMVTDSAGKPLAGAYVSLLLASTTPTTQVATVASAKTDVNGQYTFSNLMAGSYVVRASATGYQAATSAAFAVVQGATVTAPTLALVAYSTVNGTITDVAGKPLANASVILLLAGGTNSTASVASAKTDANGQYNFANVPAGSYVVRASATGYQTGTSAAFAVAQGTTVTAPTVALVAYSTVSGLVTDSTGKPLAGASVSLLLANTIAGSSTTTTASAKTDANGQYTFVNLMAGSYFARAFATGYQAGSSAVFTVAQGVTVTAPTVALVAYSTVSGLVTDSAGKPLAGASVSLLLASATGSAPTTIAASAKTDANGQYTYINLMAGSYVVSASATGYQAGSSAVFTVAQGVTVTAPTVALVAYSSVNGTITDVAGKPLANASVMLLLAASSNSTASVASARTDANGQYSFASVPGGSYVVRASATGYQTGTSAAFIVIQDAAVTAPTLALVAYSSVSGLVTDNVGKPLAGASVSLLLASATGNVPAIIAASAKTDANGQYTFINLMAGSYVVRASAPGYQTGTSAAFTVAQGATVTAPTVALVAYSTVSGLVTDSAGKPLAGASVSLLLASTAAGSSTTTVASAKTDANGQYSFVNLLAGSYVVRASATGYQAGTSAAFTVAQGATVTAPTVALVAYSTVSGLVTDSAGKPLVGASVSLLLASTTPGSSTTAVTSAKTDANGQYTIMNLMAGSYVVRASATGYQTGTSAVFVVAQGATVTAPTLALTAYSTVSGLVTDSAGKPLANASVSLLLASTSGNTQATTVASAKSDANGQYTFVNLMAGSYIVRASATGYLAATSAAFTVAQGATVIAPILALTAYSTISGLVTDSTGKPLAGASVSLLLASAIGSTQATTVAPAKTDANGQYTFINLMAGSYVVRASATGYQAGTSAAFTVAQGATVTAPTVALVAYSTVNGTITDAAGVPLANASVILLLAGSANSTASGTLAKTDANGHYSFGNLLAGSYVVQAYATGYRSATSVAFTVAEGAAVTAPTLALLLTLTPATNLLP